MIVIGLKNNSYFPLRPPPLSSRSGSAIESLPLISQLYQMNERGDLVLSKAYQW